MTPTPRHLTLPRQSAASSSGLSIPTILARRASLAGAAALVSFGVATVFASVERTSVAEIRLGSALGVTAAVSAALALTALGLLAAAFLRRREEILVRHVRESLVLGGETDLATLSRETHVSPPRLASLIRRSIAQGHGTLEARLLDDGRLVSHEPHTPETHAHEPHDATP